MKISPINTVVVILIKPVPVEGGYWLLFSQQECLSLQAVFVFHRTGIIIYQK